MAVKRWPTTLLGAGGALVAGLAGQDAPAASGMAWAALAGLALSLMLHGVGLRLVGVLVALLAVAGIAFSITSVWWLAIAFLAVAAAGVRMAIHGPRWKVQRRPKRVTDDWWQRMDAGEDPTD